MLPDNVSNRCFSATKSTCDRTLIALYSIIPTAIKRSCDKCDICYSHLRYIDYCHFLGTPYHLWIKFFSMSPDKGPDGRDISVTRE